MRRDRPLPARASRAVVPLLALTLPLLGPPACRQADPGGEPDDDGTPADDDAADDDAADDDAADDDVPDPEWSCVDGLSMAVAPAPPAVGDTVHVDITQGTGDAGYVYVELSGTDPAGGAVSASLDQVTGTGPWTWWTTHVPALTGHYAWVFSADHGDTWLCDLSIWVTDRAEGDDDDAGDDDAGCEPHCDGTPCGGDDGCGTPCSGSHRDDAGAVSDCRATGDCGCGVEPNDNMECLDSGLCRIRCSCDCLPPQDRPAADVAGLDYPGACELVFRESGDPTVWDAATGTSLCPLDHDPTGADRCTECPPCHRDAPPSCDWAQYCTCDDERWYAQYSADCCAAGAEYCY